MFMTVAQKFDSQDQLKKASQKAYPHILLSFKRITNLSCWDLWAEKRLRVTDHAKSAE